MIQAPNPLGPHQIRGGGASQRGTSRNTGWCVNMGPMGYPDRSNHCHQVWRFWNGDLEYRGKWISFCLSEKNWIKTSMGSNDTTNRNIFIRLSSRLMGRWLRRPKSYSPLWFDSWPQKWMSPFRTLKVGLTSGLKAWSQGCTPGCSAELWSQAPCGPEILTRSWVRDWAWRNKYLAPILFRAHLHNLTN